MFNSTMSNNGVEIQNSDGSGSQATIAEYYLQRESWRTQYCQRFRLGHLKRL